MASEYQAQIVISDYKRLIRELNKIEPELMRRMRADFKEIAAPVRHEIRKGIPNQPPLSGMQRKLSPVGKTWNTRRRARTVSIRLSNPKRGVDSNSSIVTLAISSPATIIADMAGRGNAGRSGKTDWYVYPLAKNITENQRPGERRHTVTTQGKHMIKTLSERLGGPSRMVYPSAERALPDAQARFYAVINDAVNMIERRLNG